MSTGRFLQHKANGGALWTPLLSWTVGIVGVVLVVLDGVLVPASLHADPVLGIGLILVVTATVLGVDSYVYRHYHDKEFPRLAHVATLTPATVSGHERRRMSWHRRGGLVHRLFVPLVALIGVVGAIPAVGRGDMRQVTAIALAVVGVEALLWFTGPAARFVVTPTHLWIDTTFRSQRVPRQRISSWSSDRVTIRLSLAGNEDIQFRVDSPLVEVMSRTGRPTRTNLGTQVRTATRIVAMLERVPYERSPDDAVTAVRRTGMVAAAIVTAVVVIVGLVVTVVGR